MVTEDAISQVTVVIVNYNAGKFLVDCVSRALSQSSKVIVVDNASTDNSLLLCEQLFPNTPALQIIRNTQNLGFATACNIGFRHVNTGYVLFLNPDCELATSAVKLMHDALERDPAAGMAGGLLLNQDASEQGGGRRAIPTPRLAMIRAFGLHYLSEYWPSLFPDFHLHNQPLPDSPIEVEAISGACMLLKSQAMNQVGLWDENYFLHCEDLDLCMKFGLSKWKILFVPAAHITHVKGVSSRKIPVFVEWHKHKGMVRFYNKYFLEFYPVLLKYLVITAVWFRFGLILAYYTARRIIQSLTISGK